ncbi:hypothetical protein ANCCEY_06101 [Ancylostoma ceylanicum]|uniref:Uncharacterized protein n=1 Tax=Ancylostoma ceylanicum TaxID=53326 RepID=A0A0D6LSG1_9BILA|nr:hypothetical protein ANCCEY_06101 [Ancylostoma ceylanicum]
MLGEIVIERQFAFYLVADYEKNQRLWISTGIVILSRLLTLLFTFSIMTEIYPHTCAIVGSSVSVVFFVIFATFMYRRNYSRLVELRSGVVSTRTINTLCAKFQLIENVRVMKPSYFNGVAQEGVVFCLHQVILLALMKRDSSYTTL